MDGELEVCPKCGYNSASEPQQYFGLRPHSILHGRYIVGRILGQGGFGITYIGFDLVLNIKVAIKEYCPRSNASRDWRKSNSLRWNVSSTAYDALAEGQESFLKEAQKMAKIDSIPEIVRIRDTFSDNNTAYIVMDYVDGITLKEYVLKNGSMELSACLKLLAPLAAGLDKVHEKGLIHRDISPDNIMIKADGKVALLDFGAAKDSNIARSNSSVRVAKHGFSPAEQYSERGNIGPWTDVYAFCATIYFCISGRVLPNAVDRMLDDTVTFDFTIKKSLTGVQQGMLDKLKRLFGNKLKVDALTRNKLSLRQRSVLAGGLAVDCKDRIQSMGELIKKFDMPVSDKFSPVSLVKKHKLMSAAAAAAVAAAAFIIVTKPWIISVDMLGISNSNMLNGGNFAYIDEQYAYYISENNALTLCRFDQETGKFNSGEAIIDDAGNINIVNNKVYFTAYDTTGKTESIQMNDETIELPYEDVYIMNADGSDPEVILSGIAISSMQYAKLSNGSELLYFFEYETDGTRTLYSYDLKKKKKTALGSDELIWYNLSGEYIYYTVFEDGENLKLMRRNLNGTGKTVLDEENMYYNGICTEDGMFMLSLNDGALYGCTPDGRQTGFVVENINIESSEYYIFERYAYGNGYIYYVSEADNSLHVVNPNQISDEVILKNEAPEIIGYCDGYICTAEIVTEGVDYEITSVSILKEQGGARTDMYTSSRWRKNILKWSDDGIFGNTDIDEDDIVSATFTNDLLNMPEDAWDVSDDSSGNVMAWTVPASNGKYDLYIGANGGVNAKKAANWLFSGYASLKSVNFGRYFHTDETQSFEYMFSSCSSLQEVDLEGFNTSMATDMHGMFENCDSLKTLNLSSFNTSKVTDMGSMFAFCGGLESIDVSSFDTSNVTDMSFMFCWNSKLEHLDVSGFDTSMVTNMYCMFKGCGKLIDFDVSHFDMSNVINDTDMMP